MANGGGGSARRSTVKDVARVAGVSPSTVSNVLHDHPNVTADKRARVEAAIAEVGYRPSRAGRQLRNGRTDTVALAIPDIRSPYFAELAHRLILEAGRDGLTLLIDETGGDPEREREIAAGYPDRGIEGVIFCPVSISIEELESLRGDLPIVLLGEHVTGGPFDHIAIDSARSAREATEFLLQTAGPRIAFAGHEKGGPRGPGSRRLDGVRDALAAHGLALPDDRVFATDGWTREEGERIAGLAAPRLDDIDGIVCAADLLAVGVLRGFHRRGVRVPDEVAVLAWDDSQEGRFSTPSLTSIAHDLDAITDRALEFLLTRNDDPELPVREFVVPHRLIPRESTPQA